MAERNGRLLLFQAVDRLERLIPRFICHMCHDYHDIRVALVGFKAGGGIQVGQRLLGMAHGETAQCQPGAHLGILRAGFGGALKKLRRFCRLLEL